MPDKARYYLVLTIGSALYYFSRCFADGRPLREHHGIFHHRWQRQVRRALEDARRATTAACPSEEPESWSSCAIESEGISCNLGETYGGDPYCTKRCQRLGGNTDEFVWAHACQQQQQSGSTDTAETETETETEPTPTACPDDEPQDWSPCTTDLEGVFCNLGETYGGDPYCTKQCEEFDDGANGTELKWALVCEAPPLDSVCPSEEPESWSSCATELEGVSCNLGETYGGDPYCTKQCEMFDDGTNSTELKWALVCEAPPLDSVCPTDEPESWSSCTTELEGVFCNLGETYGGDPYCTKQCENFDDGANGTELKWALVCEAPPLDSGCPADEPESWSSCATELEGVFCNLGETYGGDPYCTKQCEKFEDGVNGTEYKWALVCEAPPLDSGCPADEPESWSSCATELEGISCNLGETYGGDPYCSKACEKFGNDYQWSHSCTDRPGNVDDEVSVDCPETPYLWKIVEDSSNKHVGFGVGTFHLPSDIVTSDQTYLSIMNALEDSCEVYVELDLLDADIQEELAPCYSLQSNAALVSDLPVENLRNKTIVAVQDMTADMFPRNPFMANVVAKKLLSDVSLSDILSMITNHNTPEYKDIFLKDLTSGRTDNMLDMDIAKLGRPTGSLEETQTQCDLISQFTLTKEQLTQISDEEVSDYIELALNSSLSEGIVQYKCGNLDQLVETSSEAEQLVIDALNDGRNIQMATRINQILLSSDNLALFAVGTLHWEVGDESLEILLKEKGYSLKRLDHWDSNDGKDLSDEDCGYFPSSSSGFNNLHIIPRVFTFLTLSLAFLFQ